MAAKELSIEQPWPWLHAQYGTPLMKALPS
jgi:hypothetical protein